MHGDYITVSDIDGIPEPGGPDSPLIIYGDTSQNGLRYSHTGSTNSVNARQFSNHGNDVIDASNASSGLTIYGGQGNDLIFGSQSGDHIAGGSGQDEIHAGSGNDHIYGDAGINTDISMRIDLIGTTPDDDETPVPPAQVLQIVNSPAISDNPQTGDALDVNTDYIYGDEGEDITFGDFGEIIQTPGTIRILSTGNLAEIQSLNPESGAHNEIWGGSENDIIMGGSGMDTIHAGEGDDVIFGDHGYVSVEEGLSLRINVNHFSHGDVDTIHGMSGNDIIIGGVSGDTLNALSGNNIILGDHGDITYTINSNNQRSLQTVTTSNFDYGDNDTITSGDGVDILFGGTAADTITAGNGKDLLVGDQGVAYYVDNELVYLETINVTPTSLTVLRVLPGDATNDNIVNLSDLAKLATNFGMSNVDGIPMTWSDGDFNGDGVVDLVDLAKLAANFNRSAPLSIVAVDEDDTLNGNLGNDILIGGQGSDTINTGDGDNLVLGDNGYVDFTSNDNDASTLDFIETDNPEHGDVDHITSGSGNDIILGGTAGDQIHAGAGNDLIMGEFARISGDIDATQLPFTPQFTFISIFEQHPDAGNDLIHAEAGNDIILGQQGADTIYAGDGDDDLTGGHNLSDGYDANDKLDGGDGQDITSPVFFGNDFIAGGTGDDEIFGQLGDDIIQGDGSIDVNASASRNSLGQLILTPSFETALDGDDYIEGNGGSDVIFGNLGQDDIIGGSSNIFSLDTIEMRPDTSDIIFGGAGTRIDRNEYASIDNGNSDSATIDIVDEHTLDADMILGDNGNIYRFVGYNNTVGGDGSQNIQLDSGFLAYNYDNYAESRRLIVRAVELIDYTPGGEDLNALVGNADTTINPDRGAADEIHGGIGDDAVYGMVGDDIIFGDAGDDDLIGGYGANWISGGTGQDGILGDDGRILTSRNSSLGEPLFSIDPITSNQLDLEISNTGNHLESIINVNGELKKSVDLTPFNPALTGDIYDVYYEHTNADDIIFGGLGSDFIHGGAGDDAISGAEAMSADDPANPGAPLLYTYDNPSNPGDYLLFGEDATRLEEFLAYNENAPIEKVYVNRNTRVFTDANDPDAVPFLLNFDASDGQLVDTIDVNGTPTDIYTDGDDRIFGDLGNDWIVGGTGRDTLYGGFGNDVLNLDDNLDTNGGLNDTTDSHPSYADFAFGGAGRDYMIANTGADRMLDWSGEFNSYVVPFSPYGAPTILRAGSPKTVQYLYQRSESDGVDMTRAADALSDIDRNGEPYGELGAVTQKDPYWGEQHGAPDDPQPGSTGGPRDTRGGGSSTDSNQLLKAATETSDYADLLTEASSESPSTTDSLIVSTDQTVPNEQYDWEHIGDILNDENGNGSELI